MKKKLNKQIVYHTGQELLDFGVDFDAYNNAIEPKVNYKIELCHKTKKKTVLSVKDFEVREDLLALGAIQEQGLIAWSGYGCRLGFYEHPLDCLESVEKILNTTIEVNWLKESEFLIEEINKLKEHYT
jgi:hypothetical protein